MCRLRILFSVSIIYPWVKENEPGEGMVFADPTELQHALDNGVVTLHTKIKGRFEGVDHEEKPTTEVYETTPGRMILGNLLPKRAGIRFDHVNRLLTKREISALIDVVYRHCGQKETVIFCDQIMSHGFYHACRAGISFGKDDMVIPDTKDKIVTETTELVREYEQQYNDGLITQGEKYNKVVDAWAKCTDRVASRDDGPDFCRAI